MNPGIQRCKSATLFSAFNLSLASCYGSQPRSLAFNAEPDRSRIKFTNNFNDLARVLLYLLMRRICITPDFRHAHA